MKATIMVIPKWFPLTKETIKRLHEHKEILNDWSMSNLHNPNIYNILIVQSTRLVLESILSRSLEINYKTNYHYCELMRRIDVITKYAPKNPHTQMRQTGKRNIFDVQHDLFTTHLMYSNYLKTD